MARHRTRSTEGHRQLNNISAVQKNEQIRSVSHTAIQSIYYSIYNYPYLLVNIPDLPGQFAIRSIIELVMKH